MWLMIPYAVGFFFATLGACLCIYWGYNEVLWKSCLFMWGWLTVGYIVLCSIFYKWGPGK